MKDNTLLNTITVGFGLGLGWKKYDSLKFQAFQLQGLGCGMYAPVSVDAKRLSMNSMSDSE